MKVPVVGEELEMLPEKALWWISKKILLVADLHLGKINHFRKAGIPVPTKANDRNWESILHLIEATTPKRVIFLGDLFHSHYNEEWEVLRQLIKNFQEVSFELVIGNHDILSDNQYARNHLKLHRERLTEEPFVFSHHPMEEIEGDWYNLAGHIHPGVLLQGKGKQAVTLPCFYFGERQGILPAFGSFTGLARIQPKKEDRIFVIAENTVIKI
jgi:DNA ligase-associated metallophosphoesterase